MKRGNTVWGVAGAILALGGPTGAATPDAGALLRQALDPGPAVRRATITCDYRWRSRPEQHDFEGAALSASWDAIAAGKSPADARSRSDALRLIGTVYHKGMLLQGKETYRYDGTAWSQDQTGTGAVDGRHYREVWYAGAHEAYDWICTASLSRVTITTRPRAGALPFGPGLFFRRPEVAREIAHWTLQGAGRDGEGRTLLAGDIPAMLPGALAPGTVTLWVDARHGHWPARLEIRREDALLERCVATGFEKRPGGVWFPSRVVDELFVIKGPNKGAVNVRREYVVRSARFNDAAGPPPAPPAVDRSTEVRDYRFTSPVSYKTSEGYHLAAEVEQSARRKWFRLTGATRMQRRVFAVRGGAGLVMVCLAMIMITGRRRLPVGELEEP